VEVQNPVDGEMYLFSLSASLFMIFQNPDCLSSEERKSPCR
jgi:hypothetical protein